MDRKKAEELAALLEKVAETIEQNPGPVIGLSISQKGSGSMTGMKIVQTGGGQMGTMIGGQINQTLSDSGKAERALGDELRAASSALKAGQFPKDWLSGLIDRVTSLGNRALDAAMLAGIKAMIG